MMICAADLIKNWIQIRSEEHFHNILTKIDDAINDHEFDNALTKTRLLIGIIGPE